MNLAGRRADYEEELLTNFEFSLRSEWLDDRLVANANVYYGLWDDHQVSVQQSADFLPAD